ncbi:centrobin isoform X5 [Pipistrellus kuhlii]|uniref:centrobin isoform X5 n=1 Tax=Pipistrellus kuhlii TaxID=59472 RepID=UPI001E2722A1|nr:centrobin isoform X5 [Pipistrellus kuhlii]
MATSPTSPSSPLRAEDLLSDSSEAPALNQVSSEVTSQLYASLHRSRQAEATARAQLYLPSAALPPHEGLDSLAQELSRSLSVGLENNLKKKMREDGSKHIFEMESVRGQLQSMLQNSRDTAYRDPLIPGAGSERREGDSFDSESTATLLNTRPLQDLSPSSSAQALEELFPRYTSLRSGPPLNPPDFQGLRDALDSEHTRRKHCERHIQSLQTRVLELQQQLAVAVTADRKKDIMIEQLDKTLARVVEGWNQHEAERTEVLRGLQEERQAAELTRSKQQETVTRLEQSLSEALEALNREQEGARIQQRERELLEEERRALTLSLELEQQQCRALREEREEARAGQIREHQQLETLQVALEEERQAWAQQERQLKEHYQALQEEGQAQLEREKGNMQKEAQAAREAQQQLALMQAELRRAEGELDTARRETDALQLEMSLVQAPAACPCSPGPQEREKGERRNWTMPPTAVALKPVLQQSREARDELPGVPPGLCSSSPDLSLLLEPPFQNQHSFQPLEPKPDLTSSSDGAFSSAVGAFHPDHRAERPFPEEDPGAEGDGFLKQGLPPPSQLEGLKHFLQQLLEAGPQNSEDPSVDLLPPKSVPLTVPSWEEAPHVPRLPPPVHKTKVPLAMASSLFRAHELPSTHLQSSGPSSGSPERGGDGLPSSRQLMEMSQLLRLYQARAGGALPAEDLLLYLKRLEQSGTDSRGEQVSRRNADCRLGEIPRKEVPSQAVPRRLAAVPKTEKPPARKKSGHPGPGSVRSRAGIWR